MDLYFTKFPTINYNGVDCLDLSRRVKISSDIISKPNIFYPYIIENDVRSDQLADFHFSDTYQDWLLYLTNGIVDPYYGWYLSENDFNAFIVKKYGSIEQAQKKIFNYRMNWSTVDLEIPASFYDNNLPSNLKKYYRPNYGVGTKIISYTRREEDWTISTNQIVRLDINYTQGNSFSDGELVDIKTGATTTSVSGIEVITSNSSSVIIKNVSGNTANTNYIVGETSGANATITGITYLANNLADNEKVFWSPVYYYDYEVEKNEQNKHLFLLDSNFALPVSEEVRIQLRQEL